MSGNIPQQLILDIKKAISEGDYRKGRGRTDVEYAGLYRTREKGAVLDSNIIAFINKTVGGSFSERRHLNNIKLSAKQLQDLKASIGQGAGKRERSASIAKPEAPPIQKKAKRKLTAGQQQRATVSAMQEGLKGQERARAKLARQRIVPGSPDRDAILKARKQTGIIPPTATGFTTPQQPSRSHVIGGTVQGLHTGAQGYGGRGMPPATARGLRTGKKGYGGRGMSPIQEAGGFGPDRPIGSLERAVQHGERAEFHRRAAAHNQSHPLAQAVNKGKIPQAELNAEFKFSAGNVELRSAESLAGEDFNNQRNMFRRQAVPPSPAPSVLTPSEIDVAQNLGAMEELKLAQEDTTMGHRARNVIRDVKKSGDAFDAQLAAERELDDKKFKEQQEAHLAKIAVGEKQHQDLMARRGGFPAKHRQEYDVIEPPEDDPEEAVTEPIPDTARDPGPSEAPTISVATTGRTFEEADTVGIPVSPRTEQMQQTGPEAMERETQRVARQSAIPLGRMSPLPDSPLPSEPDSPKTEVTTTTDRLDRMGDQLRAGKDDTQWNPQIDVPAGGFAHMGQAAQAHLFTAEEQKSPPRPKPPQRPFHNEWERFMKDLERRIVQEDLNREFVDYQALGEWRREGIDPAEIRKKENWYEKGTTVGTRTQHTDMSIDARGGRMRADTYGPGRFRDMGSVVFSTPSKDRPVSPGGGFAKTKGQSEREIRDELRARDEKGDKDTHINPQFRTWSYQDLEQALRPVVMNPGQEQALMFGVGGMGLGAGQPGDDDGSDPTTRTGTETTFTLGPGRSTVSHQAGTGAEDAPRLTITRPHVTAFEPRLSQRRLEDVRKQLPPTRPQVHRLDEDLEQARENVWAGQRQLERERDRLEHERRDVQDHRRRVEQDDAEARRERREHDREREAWERDRERERDGAPTGIGGPGGVPLIQILRNMQNARAPQQQPIIYPMHIPGRSGSGGGGTSEVDPKKTGIHIKNVAKAIINEKKSRKARVDASKLEKRKLKKQYNTLKKETRKRIIAGKRATYKVENEAIKKMKDPKARKEARDALKAKLKQRQAELMKQLPSATKMRLPHLRKLVVRTKSLKW